ncbi:MAG: nitrous oxide-stimulated promoter family protein [Dehalococcoidia bacterium]|nr:nitrous oxide-stimulated promoter family protein [Dehalococcoidia bacterium]
MSRLFDRLTDKKGKDLRILAEFVDIYCRENHRDAAREAFAVGDERVQRSLGDMELTLCQDCGKLLSHGMAKLMLCPYDPKPSCRKCETHCYAPGYREKVRQVMKFSGMYLVKHGRVDLLAHYLL